jgi:hypothetical protein
MRVKPANTILAPFARETIDAVVAEVEQWLKSALAADQQIAYQLLLRLVRMPEEGVVFTSVPISQADLLSRGDPAQVQHVLDSLKQAGVLVCMEGTAPADKKVRLKYDALMRRWPRLADWLEKRRLFRDAALFWETHNREPGALFVGRLLDEALGYWDLNDLEEQFIAACQDESRRLAADKQRAYERELKLTKARASARYWRTLVLVVGVFLIISLVLTVWAITERLQAAKANKVTLNALIEKHKSDLRAVASEQARLAKETEQEGIEMDAAARSMSNLAVALLLMSEQQGPVHAAKKLLIVQTLRQVLFARNENVAEASRKNWQELEEQLAEHDPVKRQWFHEFLREGEYSAKIKLIISGPPISGRVRENRGRIDALREVTQELKQYINDPDIPDTQKALAIIRPLVVGQAVRIAERIKGAAEAGDPLSKVEPYQLAFWRLSSGGLVIVADADLEKSANQFAMALQKWEDGGGTASADAIAAIRRGLESLQAENARLKHP